MNLTEEELKELIRLTKEYRYYFGDESYANHLAAYVLALMVSNGLVEEEVY